MIDFHIPMNIPKNFLIQSHQKSTKFLAQKSKNPLNIFTYCLWKSNRFGLIDQEIPQMLPYLVNVLLVCLRDEEIYKIINQFMIHVISFFLEGLRHWFLGWTWLSYPMLNFVNSPSCLQLKNNFIYHSGLLLLQYL